MKTSSKANQAQSVKSFKGTLSRAQRTRIFRDSFLREVTVNYQALPEVTFKMSAPEDVAAFVRKVLVDNSREHLIALYLDGSHQVTSYSIVSIGTATNALVHPREVFQRALGAGAVALVLAHNHPSGNTQPSDADRQVTRQLKEAGQLLGIELLDHVIVTGSSHHSFRSENQL